MNSIESSTIMVTGASRGIGLAITRALAKSGASIMAQYFNTKPAFEAPNLSWFRADLSDLKETGNFFKHAVRKAGQIHGLVNNAGIALYSPLDSPDEEWLENWHLSLRVNLLSAALLSKKCIEQFPDSGGRIVNITSRAAHRGDTLEYMAYASSKAGMGAMGKSIARGLGKRHVKVFNIAPGFTVTDMATDFIDKYGEDIVKKDLALPDITKPEDISPLVVFLLSGSCDHATGSTFDLNAGSYVR